MEIWKTIPEAPAYSASSRGRIRNDVTGKIMTPRLRPDGYRQIGLREGQPKRLSRKVNQLVTQAFHGPRPFPKAVAAHRDGTRDNDTPGNLYWATHTQNHADRETHGRAPIGSRNAAAKLSEGEVLEIRKLLRQGHAQAVLADQFGVCSSTISHINTNKHWSHI